jgi:hypothetical protein
MEVKALIESLEEETFFTFEKGDDVDLWQIKGDGTAVLVCDHGSHAESILIEEYDGQTVYLPDDNKVGKHRRHGHFTGSIDSDVDETEPLE